MHTSDWPRELSTCAMPRDHSIRARSGKRVSAKEMAEAPRSARKSPAFEVQTRFANEPFRCENYGDGRPIELTSLWEHVQRVGRLPLALDRNALYRELASRMGYPEWEVRQHALRVLADLAPALPRNDLAAALDSPMLLPATVTCLGHPSAGVRRAALDALRALLVASEDPDLVVDALVIHGLDGADPEVAMGVILGVPALFSPRLPHHGLVRLVSALARKVIHSAFHEEALETLSKIRGLVGEGQFDRFLSGFPPKYKRDFRALFRAHDVRNDNEDSSAETRARVREMLANGILNEVEDPSKPKTETPETPAKVVEKKETPGTPVKTNKIANVKEVPKRPANIKEVAEEEENDSANGSRPASAETKSEEKTKTLQVPEEEDEASLSDNDRASVDPRGKDGEGGTEEEGGELEEDEDSGVEGSGGRGEETTGPSSPPPSSSGRVLLETEIQFSEATAITMTILEEAEVASNDGVPIRRVPDSPRRDFSIRVIETSEEESVKDDDRGGRRVRFGGETLLQTPDSTAETLEVPKKEEGSSVENSSEDMEKKEDGSKSVPFVSHIPVRVDKKKGSDGEKNGEEVIEVKTEATENTKVKLEAEGKELELLVQEVSGESQDCEGPAEVRVDMQPINRIHGWEDLGIVDKSVIMDIKNKEDWQARGRGMQILKTALRDPMVASLLYSHLPEFLLFLDPLLEDRSIPVVTAALGIVRSLATTAALRPRLSSPAILRRLTSSLTRRVAHAHIAVRAAAASAAKALMRATGPRTLLPPLLTLASAPRAPGHRVRESALILALHALIAFPSAEFDAAEVARRAVPALADPKRRVRQAALECMAVLAQFVPPESLPLDLAKLRSRKARKAMEAAVAARLSRRRLPVLTSDGLILYALQIPPTASRGMPGTPTGADVDWILAGTGSISAGSALSRGNYVLNRHDSPLLPTTVAQVPVYYSAPPHRPGSPVGSWGKNVPTIAPLDQRSQSAGTLAPLQVAPPVLASGSALLCLDHGPQLSLPFLEITPVTNGQPIETLLQQPWLLQAIWCGRLQENEKPPTVGLSPWSAAADRRKAPSLHVASMSSSFSSSTSSTSSASSASSSKPTIGYFRPVYNGPRQMGLIEDVVSDRGFSVLPNNIPATNAVILSPPNEIQGHRRLRSPSPQDVRRRRQFSRQSSTDSRPSTPTSNDSSIPPHSSAPLPVLTQTTIVATGRRNMSGPLRIPEPPIDDVTDYANSSLQERLVTSDDSSTPSRSDSTVRGKVVSIKTPLVLEKERNEPGTPKKMEEIDGAAAEGGAPAVVEVGKETIRQESAHPCVPEGSADADGDGAVVEEKGEVVEEATAEVGEAVLQPVEEERVTVGENEGGNAEPTEGVEEKASGVEEVEEVKKMVDEDAGKEEVDKVEEVGETKVVEEEVGELKITEEEGGETKMVGEEVVVEAKVVGDDEVGEANVVGDETKEDVRGEESGGKGNEEGVDCSPPKSNGGGVAVPIDLSVGLLGVEFDDPPHTNPPQRPTQLDYSLPEEYPVSASFSIANMQGKGANSSTISTSSLPPGVYTTKSHAKHQRLSQQSRRTLPPRNGYHKLQSSSAPNVHATRTSTMSTALFPETLPPLKNPKESLKQAFQSMDDPDWEVAMKGLEILVRLIRHHPSYVQAELTRVIATLGRQIRNLRSQVARAACQASGELALPRVSPSSPSSITSDGSTCASSLLKRALEADLEEVAAPLLHRSADTNRFLRDDCVAALDRFVAGVGPSRVVGPILSKGVTHQNALVRTVTARLLATIVAKLGPERVMTQLNKDVRAKVLRAGANLLMEGSLQTRTFAKQVFRSLASHETFDRALATAVPTQVLRNIHKTLLIIKKESIASSGVDPTWNG